MNERDQGKGTTISQQIFETARVQRTQDYPCNFDGFAEWDDLVYEDSDLDPQSPQGRAKCQTAVRSVKA
jgi:hypothetical protein